MLCNILILYNSFLSVVSVDFITYGSSLNVGTETLPHFLLTLNNDFKWTTLLLQTLITDVNFQNGAGCLLGNAIFREKENRIALLKFVFLNARHISFIVLNLVMFFFVRKEIFLHVFLLIFKEYKSLVVSWRVHVREVYVDDKNVMHLNIDVVNRALFVYIFNNYVINEISSLLNLGVWVYNRDMCIYPVSSEQRLAEVENGLNCISLV